MKKFAILLFAVTVFGIIDSSVFAQSSCAPYTTSQTVNASHPYNLIVERATPCATCLSNCKGSQDECAEECKSVCAHPYEIVGLSSQLALRCNDAVFESRLLGYTRIVPSNAQQGCYTAARSKPQQGYFTTSRSNRRRCFLGWFRN